MNKRLLILIVVLIPIVVISFFKKKTNFILEESNIIIKVKKDDTILQIPLEEYVIGVVAAEMPALYHEEALKAQAVAARTYVLNYYDTNNEYDVDNTTKYQAYIDKEEMQDKWLDKFDKYYNKIKTIVSETNQEIITYNNILIKSLFFAKSNGFTENSQSVFKEELPYLISVESNEDNNESTVKVSKIEFCNKLAIVDCSNIVINNIIRNKTNRVDKITINNKDYLGTEIRKIFKLKSTDFYITINDEIEIKTYGYGHGVGMSQYGANVMAKKGYTYQDIIKHYYQNTEIVKIDSIIN